MSQTATHTATYTEADVEIVVRRVKTDLRMIADSTGGWTRDEVEDYAHDIEELAKREYLKWVDVTLFIGNTEVQAARYTVDTESGRLESDRPGGTLWPRQRNGRLRIVLCRTDKCPGPIGSLDIELKVDWQPSSEDASHTTLTSGIGRTYSSNGFGIERQDWA